MAGTFVTDPVVSNLQEESYANPVSVCFDVFGGTRFSG
jgi:hypothetical protein